MAEDKKERFYAPPFKVKPGKEIKHTLFLPDWPPDPDSWPCPSWPGYWHPPPNGPSPLHYITKVEQTTTKKKQGKKDGHANEGALDHATELLDGSKRYQELPQGKEDLTNPPKVFDLKGEMDKLFKEGDEEKYLYLLLDHDQLVAAAGEVGSRKHFRAFCGAIFYVGKGGGDYPETNINKFHESYKNPDEYDLEEFVPMKPCFVHTWNAGHKVLLFYPFCNITDKEALFRRGCMKKAIGFGRDSFMKDNPKIEVIRKQPWALDWFGVYFFHEAYRSYSRKFCQREDVGTSDGTQKKVEEVAVKVEAEAK